MHKKTSEILCETYINIMYRIMCILLVDEQIAQNGIKMQFFYI